MRVERFWAWAGVADGVTVGAGDGVTPGLGAMVAVAVAVGVGDGVIPGDRVGVGIGARTTVDAVAELLSWLGSFAFETTVAVLLMVPACVGVPTKTTVALLLGGRVPS
jgi:hypothetical protein